MKDLGLDSDSLYKHYLNNTLLEVYQTATSNVPKTKITLECQHRFDLVGKPIPLELNKKTNKARKDDS